MESTTQVLQTVPCTRKERKEAEELEKLRRFGARIGGWLGRHPVREEQDDEPQHNGYTVCGGSSNDEDDSDEQPRRTTRFVYGQQAKDEPIEVKSDADVDNRKNVLATLAIIIVVAAIVWLIGDAYRDGRMNNGELTNTSGGSPAAMTASEEDEFVIDMPRRDGNRLNADGVSVKDDPEAFRAQIAEQAKHDPLTLFVYYNYSPLGKTKPIQNVADLVKDGLIKDGNVYSDEGRSRYEEWLILWNVADIRSVSEITFQGANTGVVGTQVTQSNGVTGSNKAGYDIRYQDGQGNTVGEHSALERCTQPTGGRPGIPTGPTDNDDDDGLEPKSSNPADYKQPGDGPERDSGTGTRPPSTVTTPADASPPNVVTSVRGGGGVVDTPTNPPGSESGVTAPGATEPDEEPVPEPEQGVNPTDGSANTGDPGLPAGF